MTGKEDAGFDFETMAVVLYCVLESGVTLGDKHYQMMSALDGKRSASAYQHQFRKVKARAKELQQQAASGGSVGTPVKGKAKGGSKKATPATSAKKRGRKAASEADDEDDDESPTKKAKAEVKAEAEQSEDDEYV